MKQTRCSDVFVFAGPCSGVPKATVKPFRSALAQQKGQMFCQDIEFHWTSLGTESHLNPNFSAHKQGQKASGTVNEISTQQYHNI